MERAAATAERKGRAGKDGRDAEVSYQAMAPLYDDFTAHHDYELWLGNLMPKLARHGIAGRRLLDIGCGTGKSFIPMLRRGWEVTACDISPAMVELARAKAGGAARLSVADMRELPAFGEFDLVWALDDAVNYLLSGEELERALRGMRANLAPDGLLMFDVNCLYAYRTFFAEEQRVQRGGRTLRWRGLGSADAAPGSLGEARFEVASAPDAERFETHVHRQRHFPEAEVRARLAAAGLESSTSTATDTTPSPRQPVDELTHDKAVYMARRA